MNKPFRRYLTIAALAAALITLYWLLPISGKLAYVPDAPPQLAVWPQINVVNKGNDELEVIVQDVTPGCSTSPNSVPSTFMSTKIVT